MASVTINTTTETVLPHQPLLRRQLSSVAGSYTSARNGSNISVIIDQSFVGQLRPSGNWSVTQNVVVFPTQTLREGVVYTSAVLRADLNGGIGQGDLQVRLPNEPAVFPIPDANCWLSPGDYGDLLASTSTDGDGVEFSGDLISEVDLESYTLFLLIDSKTVSGTSPGTDDSPWAVNDPVLVFEHGAFIDVEIVETLGVSDEIELPAPTVTVTEPSAPVTSGGPTLTFEWDYESVLGVPQEQFRVVVTDGSETTTYYDSGWRIGNDNSWSIDAVARGIPTDTDDLAVTIEVRSTFADTPLEGSSGATAFEMQWGEVTLTVDSPTPGEEINTSQVTVEWTFDSTRSKTQGEWRVRLLAGSSSTVLYDSGWTEGTEDSFEVPFILTPGGSYRVGVQVRNSEGVPNG